MSHHTQKNRESRLVKVRDWLTHATVKAVINRCIRDFGCTREKAIEYIAEATRE